MEKHSALVILPHQKAELAANFSILHEVSLVEGMKELMLIYHVIGKIPAIRNISNKIIVLEKCD